MYLDKTHGLEALDIRYSADIPENKPGKPYWVADGQVSMERKTYDYAGEHGIAAEQFWGQARRFFVPAYQAPLASLLKVAKGMLLDPPGLNSGSAVRFDAVTLYHDDV
jgi:hypothetical protein